MEADAGGAASGMPAHSLSPNGASKWTSEYSITASRGPIRPVTSEDRVSRWVAMRTPPKVRWSDQSDTQYERSSPR